MEVTFYDELVQEYDLKAANISILMELGYITEDVYQDLIEGDKLERNIIIGKLCRDDEGLSSTINDSIKKYVDKFIHVNNVKTDEILEIAKDAVFTSNNNIKVLEFGDYVRFIPKMTYDMMLELRSGSKVMKIYLTSKNELITRYGKLDKEHLSYCDIIDLIRFKRNGNTRAYDRKLREFIFDLKYRGVMTETFTNEDIIEAFVILRNL